MEKKTLLVTGGCGFIGSNFIRYILNKYPGYKIINLDKLTYAGNPDNLKEFENDPRYKLVIGDICNKELVNEIVKEVDIIVHFAAESHVDLSIFDSRKFIETNVLGTQTLLEAAKINGRKRFHHISTDEVYGVCLGNNKFSESTPYSPRNPYSASKAGSDHLVMAYYYTHNLPVTISNCSNNYGPYQYPEKLFARAITNLLTGEKIILYGDGKGIRDWIYVEDHCRAIDLIIHKGNIGSTYCIGGNCEKLNIEIANAILSYLGISEENIEYVSERPGADSRYAIDFSKIKKELGWEPKTNFEEGVKKTVEWYKENKQWWLPLREEMKKNRDSFKDTFSKYYVQKSR
jgi:dTDP-glucose 4,6-dehydratase